MYTDKQKSLLSAYTRLAQKLSRHPTRAEMRDIGFSRDQIRQGFTSLEGLKEAVIAENPKAFEKIYDPEVFQAASSKSLKQALNSHSAFLITCAVSGAPVHEGFLRSLSTMASYYKAEILVMPSGQMDEMDPLLADAQWVFADTPLNSNIRLSAIKIPPKSANPLTSLQRLGQRNGSLIAASPKQFLEFVAMGNSRLPHAIMTTGAITAPAYQSKKGVNRTDYIANHDHVLGAILVELDGSKEYHFRQIQADTSGRIFDLGIEFNGTKVKKCKPLAMRWGDLHAGEVDPAKKKASFEIMKATGVRTVYLEDAFSGISINHHEEENHISRAMLAQQGKMLLEEEFRILCRELNDITERADQVFIVHSNHHDFLSKHYLQKGKYLPDHHNFKIATQLVAAMMEGHDPLRYACEKIIGLKHPEKIRWLKMDEDNTVAGIQMGAHGHKGANGSKGSKRTLENAYGRIMHGHTHSPYIYRGVSCVGTSSILRPGFNEGPSGWVHTDGLVYPTGAIQLVNIINGRWRPRGLRSAS